MRSHKLVSYVLFFCTLACGSSMQRNKYLEENLRGRSIAVIYSDVRPGQIKIKEMKSDSAFGAIVALGVNLTRDAISKNNFGPALAEVDLTSLVMSGLITKLTERKYFKVISNETTRALSKAKIKEADVSKKEIRNYHADREYHRIVEKVGADLIFVPDVYFWGVIEDEEKYIIQVYATFQLIDAKRNKVLWVTTLEATDSLPSIKEAIDEGGALLKAKFEVLADQLAEAAVIHLSSREAKGRTARPQI